MKRVKKLIVVFIMMFAITTVVPISTNMGGTKVEAATKVKLNKSNAYVVKGSTVSLSVKGTSRKAQWKSSNKKIATVSSKGVVKGIKKGTVTITAKVKGKNYKCKVTVETPSLNMKSAKITVGKTVSLKLKDTKQKITWKSSDKKVAVVSSKGVVKGVKNGKATITAMLGGKKFATCQVVVNKPVPVSENIKKLQAYIDKNGTLEEDGNKYITLTQKDGTTEYTYAIGYVNGKLVLAYASIGAENSVIIGVDANLLNNSIISPSFILSSTEGDSYAIAQSLFDSAKYKADSTVYFSLLSAEGYKESGIQKLANAELQRAFKGWSTLISKNTGMTLSDIGFLSYK